ncbi:MAG: hypothetical protein HKN43_12455 [Rhodothermales bacterium]|nr:hypothetical protein [Rhodothermales bacterium]
MSKSSSAKPIALLEYTMEGGLARMLDRYRDEGTLTGDLAADAYLSKNANGLLLGLLYDQRVRAEYAFTGPIRLQDRLGHLDMAKIAAMESERFKVEFAKQPAVHRFTNKMADNTQAVAEIIARDYGGNAANMWNDGADFDVIQKRVQALPGFGKAKAMKMRYVLHYFGYRDFS